MTKKSRGIRRLSTAFRRSVVEMAEESLGKFLLKNDELFFAHPLEVAAIV